MPALKEITTSEFLELLEQGTQQSTMDLQFLDLRGVDMRHADVRQKFTLITHLASLSSAEKPYSINFSHSNISGRDFSHYSLIRCILQDVVAEHTIFTGSDLTDVHLEHASLDFADMRFSNLSYAKLFHTSIRGTNFTGANLATTKGLNLLNLGDDTIKRMGVVGSIREAVLSEEAEAYREAIEERIRQHQPRQPSPLQTIKGKSEGGW